ncbi:MAG: FAD-dependent oxidoreductase [Pseudomonadota bacterium]
MPPDSTPPFELPVELPGRRRFLKQAASVATLLSPFALAACGGSGGTTSNSGSAPPVTGPTGFEGEVLIIGAGAAGMSAGHLLFQQGIRFQILEAQARPGGRMRHDTTFTDFPVSLGAEWLHVPRDELNNIVNDDTVSVDIETRGYSTNDSYGRFSGGELSLDTLGRYDDLKFIASSWMDFFERFVLPNVSNQITYETPITSINYSGERLYAEDASGNRWEADKIIVTVPLAVLQNRDVSFTPALPATRTSLIEDALIWGGFKAFFEFSDAFYPTFLDFDDSDTSDGQRTYYDAAYGQSTSTNLLGLFAVGRQAEPYQALAGDAQHDYILAELDEVFDGAATASYQRHLVQDWNAEPYARGAYLADVSSLNITRELARSIDGRLYFAGDAYTQEDDWGAVHNAARSARDAVTEILASA